MKQTNKTCNTLVFIALSVFLLNIPTASAQFRKYNQPDELVIKPYIGDTVAEPAFYNSNEYYLNDFFYPVGWSEDGKFAYAVIPADEACGCHFFEFYIKDMKTNKVEWKFKDTYQYDADRKKAMEDAWKRNRKNLTVKMKKYEIQQQDDFTLKSFPIPYQNEEVHIYLKSSRNKECWYNEISKIKIELYMASKGKALVEKKEYDCNDADYNPGPLEVEIGGYLENPYNKNQITIIINNLWKGYEGPPHVYKYVIAGFDLSIGF